jgi:eukaryotic translation initiation factor 2C
VQAGASHTGVRVGKNKYFFGPSQGSLGGGVEGLRGYFASVRPVWKSMMVNVNVCMTAFIESKNMAVAIEEFQRGSRGAMPQLSAMFGKSVLRVKTRHLGHRKKVWKIEDKNCNQLSFPCEELGGTVTVAHYFRKSEYISVHLLARLMFAIRIPKYPSQES